MSIVYKIFILSLFLNSCVIPDDASYLLSRKKEKSEKKHTKYNKKIDRNIQILQK